MTDTDRLNKYIESAKNKEYDEQGNPLTNFGLNYHLEGMTVEEMLEYQKKAINGGGSSSGDPKDYIESTDTVERDIEDYYTITGEGQPTGVTSNGVRSSDMGLPEFDDWDDIVSRNNNNTDTEDVGING